MNSWNCRYLWLKSELKQLTVRAIVPLPKHAWIRRCGGNLLVQQRYLSVRPNVVKYLWTCPCHDQWPWPSCESGGPSTPVSITGLNSANGGWPLAVYEDEKSARAAGEERATCADETASATNRVSLENLFDTAEGWGKWNLLMSSLNDGPQGSVAASLQKGEGGRGVKVTIVHSAVGAINESDVTLTQKLQMPSSSV